MLSYADKMTENPSLINYESEINELVSFNNIIIVKCIEEFRRYLSKQFNISINDLPFLNENLLSIYG